MIAEPASAQQLLLGMPPEAGAFSWLGGVGARGSGGKGQSCITISIFHKGWSQEGYKTRVSYFQTETKKWGKVEQKGSLVFPECARDFRLCLDLPLLGTVPGLNDALTTAATMKYGAWVTMSKLLLSREVGKRHQNWPGPVPLLGSPFMDPCNPSSYMVNPC